jgi:hypothetical protein
MREPRSKERLEGWNGQGNEGTANLRGFDGQHRTIIPAAVGGPLLDCHEIHADGGDDQHTINDTLLILKLSNKGEDGTSGLTELQVIR